jgi:hypothetical protein
VPFALFNEIKLLIKKKSLIGMSGIPKKKKQIPNTNIISKVGVAHITEKMEIHPR